MTDENQDGEYISVGDSVFAIDDGFEPVVQEGVVVEKRELDHSYNEIDVHFPSDPMHEEKDSSRVIGGMSTQFISINASAAELADKLSFPRP